MESGVGVKSARVEREHCALCTREARSKASPMLSISSVLTQFTGQSQSDPCRIAIGKWRCGVEWRVPHRDCIGASDPMVYTVLSFRDENRFLRTPTTHTAHFFQSEKRRDSPNGDELVDDRLLSLCFLRQVVPFLISHTSCQDGDHGWVRELTNPCSGAANPSPSFFPPSGSGNVQ